MKQNFSLKDLCLPLAIAAGILIVFGNANIQGMLSAGDHGRDLYAFERTLHGDAAYRDYWWVYGPLMPFYYALFMKLYGTSILSVLLGKAVLKLTAGLFIFMAVSRIAQPLAALLCSLWFYLFFQDFFFTYNHIGGIMCVTAVTAMLLSYVRDRAMGWLWASTLISLVLCFIKLNFGLAGLVMTAAGTLITDTMLGIRFSPNKASFYRTTLVYIPIVVAAGYFYCLNGLSIEEIRQCMPYATADHPYNTTILQAVAQFWGFFTKKFFSNSLDFFFGCIIIASLIRLAWMAMNRRLFAKGNLNHLIALGITGTYFVLNFHEYLKSGTWYSSLWSLPITFMFFFILISLAIHHTGRALKLMVWSAVLLIAATAWHNQSQTINLIRVPAQHIEHPRAKVFVINNQGWINAVLETTDFLEKNLKPGEKFFALPYDPIYYYLTGRQSPTQLLIYFEHINIKPEQERKIIADLERNHVNWVVVSSRMRTAEAGLGTLGATYCPVIGEYLNRNFIITTQFGDWTHDAGWAANHGTLILKRNNPL